MGMRLHLLGSSKSRMDKQSFRRSGALGRRVFTLQTQFGRAHQKKERHDELMRIVEMIRERDIDIMLIMPKSDGGVAE